MNESNQIFEDEESDEEEEKEEDLEFSKSNEGENGVDPSGQPRSWRRFPPSPPDAVEPNHPRTTPSLCHKFDYDEDDPMFCTCT